MGKGRVRKAVTTRLRKWSDYDQIMQTGKSLKEFLLSLFVPQRTSYQESLTQAMSRLQLSAEDIRNRMRSFKRLTVIMLVIAAIVFLYSVYLFMHRHLAVAGISLLMMGLPLMLAFRYHFWFFQLKQGKLGCSLSEWFIQGVLGRKAAVQDTNLPTPR